MAPTPPPHFTEKRKILHGERIPDDARLAAAQAFFDAERFGETLEMLERVRDDGLLSRVGDEAVRRGDTFLLLRVEKIRGREFDAGTWRNAARAAEGRGRFLDAYRAFTRAGDPERAEAIRAAEMPGYQPFRPEGKAG